MNKRHGKRLQFSFRMPEDIADWLAARASETGASINNLIIFALRQVMSGEPMPALPAGAATITVQLSEESINELAAAISRAVSMEAKS